MALVRRNGLLLRAILEELRVDSPNRTPVQRQLGDLYAAALDQETINARGIDPIRADLERIEALDNREGLAPLVASLHTRGIGALFEVMVDADARRSDVYALEVSQGGLNLPDRDYYLEPRFAKELAAYRNYMAVALRIAGEEEKAVAADVRTVVSIEMALARASKKLEGLGDPEANYHKMSRADLVALAPSFGWDDYWKGVGAGEVASLVVGQPGFFKALEAQLRARTLDEWKAYLRWNVINGSALLLFEPLEKAHFEFYGRTLQGTPRQEPRWKLAIHQVNRCLGESLGQIYMERHFPESSRSKVEQLVENLRGTFSEELSKNSWMQPETKQEAVAKFSRFRTKIAGPSKPRDYSALEIRRDQQFENVRRSAESEWRRDMARIGKPVDREEWQMNAHVVNAYFKPTANEIVFPAGILQPPFFDPSMDDAVNYGAIGATIGHEMTHGYDNEGRKYDAAGNLRNWWTVKDTAEFQRRSWGLIEQFNRFTPVANLKVNGRLTLAENIADLGGIRIAYRALQKELEKAPSKRQTIDGLTPEQRFFISYAQSWAALIRPESLRASLTTDTHAPDILRGFAPLMHMDEFYSAFGIKPTAAQAIPKKWRATVW